MALSVRAGLGNETVWEEEEEEEEEEVEEEEEGGEDVGRWLESSGTSSKLRGPTEGRENTKRNTRRRAKDVVDEDEDEEEEEEEVRPTGWVGPLGCLPRGRYLGRSPWN